MFTLNAVPKPQKQKKVSEHTPKKKLRKMIAERDGDWCLLCGRPKGDLQIHRVIYGSEGGRYMIYNCVQLCPFCHVPIVHADKRKWQPKLVRYLQLAGSEEGPEWLVGLQKEIRSRG